MNREFLESLPPYQRKTIEHLYRRVLNNELAPGEFFSECNAYLGPNIFGQLFPGEKEIKTEKLGDVIEYSGVDLKQEMEMIKGVENVQVQYNDTDALAELNELANPEDFIGYVIEIAEMMGMTVNVEAIKYIFYSLRRYLLDFSEKMDRASFYRSDPGKLHRKLRVVNDIRRQLWYLDEREKKDEYYIKDDERKEKKDIQEREDIIIKKRLSNNVALAALGSQKKSWMEVDVVEETPFLSLYSPIDEKDQEKKVLNRRITIEDFLYVLERDRNYNKSVFILKHYYEK